MGRRFTVVEERDRRSLRSKESLDIVKRLMSYLKEDKIFVFLAIFFTAASTIFDIFTPWILGLGVTSIFNSITNGTGIDYSYLIRIILILGALYITSSLFLLLRGRMLVKATQNMTYRLREDLSRKVKKLPLSYLDQHKVGDLLSRMTNDMDSIGNNMRQNIAQIISAFVTIIGILIMMFSIEIRLTLVALISLPLSGLITGLVASKSQHHFRKKSSTLGKLDGYLEEMVSGQEVVKSYTFEEVAIKEFQEINKELYQASYKSQFISGLIMPLTSFVSNIGYVIITVLGGILVLNNALTIGAIQAFIQYSRKINQPISQMAEVVSSLQSAIAAAGRIFQVLDAEEEAPVTNREDLPEHCCGEVSFENVFFGYNEDEMVIQDFSLEVNSGETIAIVGPTGAGKTTLINLLMRFYDVNKGSIKIDGTDIREIPRDDLRNIFGMVLQDTWLFSDTIFANIAYGKPGATMEDVVKAAKATFADNFIRTLPEGYDTIIHEDGSSISSGQRQLLTIARALVSDPDILILDEATSSVDTRTEKLIQKAMDELMKGRTNFVIAHRLSTIVGADKILVLQNGNIVEQGSHEELIAKQGEYYNLYNAQFDEEESA
ncbi:ABC transporter ATP-binding protein/permease [Peptoniphilus sp. KCTC 25270]|uniref:ABC transporter ATP-binding protein n=1 Tax=Peptoniphilus sp. KCTC 25270 TaxID=2897414 RepID=UPI001E4EA648|nr:ABC transporter ATP-binding protein [Peptoniphilus sp. KCTC 25270]MCD1147703.1 ABC transporter ATP-binding protein/permease [Peptoniphilus sp. KCTC 25270]